MSMLADFSHVAVVEMLAVLGRMREHCGSQFQITNKAIKQTLKERFGVSFAYKGTGRELFQHVVDTLTKRGLLTIWDVRTRNKTSLVIYQVNTFALMNNGTRERLNC